MEQPEFGEQDLKQMEDHGLTLAEVNRQLELFSMPRPFLKLVAPCRIEDGIRTFDRERRNALTAVYEKERPGKHFVKFVPASGAASRMFKVLLRYLHQDGEITRSSVVEERSAGGSDAEQFLTFADGLEKFPFFKDLQSIMADHGLSVDPLVEQGRFRDILRFLLTEDGLDYAHKPKGLLKFHVYPEGSRTAFEEHLIEAAFYVADGHGRCALSFTVSQEHMDGFKATLRKAREIFEGRFGVQYDVSFSVQEPSTDTIAVDMDNVPFRQKDGRLLFRPGGHGALLRNLNRIDGDIIFLKNIDNVVPDHLKPETFVWKKITAGYLIEVQRRIFAYMEKLASQETPPRLLDEAADFLKRELLISVPEDLTQRPFEERRDFLVESLDRPVRVCGMVKNVGEPGGGPFWVEDASGQRSLQIVETAQIDFDDREQREIVEASTHFNPVDLVCGVRDWRGMPFDLSRYVDPKAVFISKKAKDGRDLKALEHPGLWNGSMSRWITLFVEVPSITFNPVKTVNDLLRKEHQPI